MPEFVRIIIGVLLIVVLIGIFIFTYLLNKKTPKPEGCENMSGECEGCQILTCSHNQQKNNTEGEEK